MSGSVTFNTLARTTCAALSLCIALLVWSSQPATAQAPPEPSTKQAPETFKAAQRATLDALFAALSAADGDDAARDLVTEIWRVWTQSGRSDVDSLMLQAATAMPHRHFGLAGMLLDEVVALAPDFAEGWNRRATLRWMMGDHAGSLEDIDKVLALEPRHFGALVGRAMISVDAGRFESALGDYRRALTVNPFLPERHRVIPTLQKKLGRDL